MPTLCNKENTKKYTQVQEEITKRAREFGNKSAHLQELIGISLQKELSELRFDVPAAYYLCHETIYQHLNEHTPEWKKYWDSFKLLQGAERGELNTEALDALRQLRSLISKTFVEHPLPETVFEFYLKKLGNEDGSLMVRSTGEEDTAKVANPGGNESVAAVAPNVRAISEAIGTVVASYFSEKSLKQRLLSSASDVTKDPFMPVLLQRMVGERLQETKDNEEVVRSGVMYTNAFETHIQIAPGHGELIVNSRAPFDTFTVTENNIIYPEIHHKPVRLVPDSVSQLVLKKNSKILKETPSISPDVTLRLAKIGRAIETHYGIPMDVEFVYDPKKDMIYLVQARPIPKGDLEHVLPSSVSPSKVSELKVKAREGEIRILNGEVITPAGNAAKIITDPREILVCNTIETALTHYLTEKKSRVQAVIVAELAPKMSHEAAQFSSKAIPVLQIANIRAVEELIEQPNRVLIIDPQRNQLIDWTEQRETPTSILETGFFTLPASPTTVSSLHYLEESTKKEIHQFFTGKPIKLKSRASVYTNLLHAFETLEAAKAGKNNAECNEALNYIVTIFRKMGTSKNAGKEIKALLPYAMTAAFEVARCLERYEQNSISEEPILREALLLRIAKLKSLVIYPGSASVFSQSIVQMATEKKWLEKCMEFPGASNLLPLQLSYFIQFMRLSKTVLNEDLQKEWSEFSFFCCKNPISRQTLTHLIKFALKNGIESDLIHSCFVRAKAQNPNDNQAVLDSMRQECLNTANELNQLALDEHKQMIKQWEQRINEWSHPGKFDGLWQAYTNDINLLMDKLTISPSMPAMTQKAVLKTVQDLSELMDRSIKSMKGSQEYKTMEERLLLVNRFALLLEPYHRLMEQWMMVVPEAQYLKWSEGIWQDSSHNSRSKMLLAIKEKFEKRKTSEYMRESELLPSGNFSVASAQIGTCASFSRQFVDISTTLEDLFSLMHQNILATTSFLGRNEEIIKQLPTDLKSLHTALVKQGRGGLYSKNFSLLSIVHSYPIVGMEYNYPLNNHSAKLTVQYDQKTQKTTLHFHIFGHNQRERMSRIVMFSRWEEILLGLQVKKEAQYNDATREFDFIWEVSPTLLSNVASNLGDALYDYGEMTFIDGSGSKGSGYPNLLKRHEKSLNTQDFLQRLAEKSNIPLKDVTELCTNLQKAYSYLDLQYLEMLSRGTQFHMISMLSCSAQITSLFVQAGIISYEKILAQLLKLGPLDQIVELSKMIQELEEVLPEAPLVQHLKQLKINKIEAVGQIELFQNAYQFMAFSGILSFKKLLEELRSFPEVLTVELVCTISSSLNMAKRVDLFNLIKNRVPELVHSLKDFEKLTRYFGASEYLIAFEMVKDLFCAEEFEKIVSAKKIKQLDQLFVIMKPRLLDIMVTPSDLALLKKAVSNLSRDQYQKVLESFSDDQADLAELLKKTKADLKRDAFVSNQLKVQKRYLEALCRELSQINWESENTVGDWCQRATTYPEIQQHPDYDAQELENFILNDVSLQEERRHFNLCCSKINDLKTLRTAILAVKQKAEEVIQEGIMGKNQKRKKEGEYYQEISKKLLASFQTYLTSPKQTKQQFFDACEQILASDFYTQTIRHHTIWKPLLAAVLNALICLTGIGAIIQLGYYAHNKHLLFKETPTEIEGKLKAVSQEIEQEKSFQIE